MPLDPARMLDTRKAIGVASVDPVAGGGSVRLAVDGQGDIPLWWVSAVVLNVTVTQPSAGGTVVVYPGGTAVPLASNLNFSAGQTIPNLVVVKVGADGGVILRNNSVGGATHLIADLAGYFNA